MFVFLAFFCGITFRSPLKTLGATNRTCSNKWSSRRPSTHPNLDGLGILLGLISTRQVLKWGIPCRSLRPMNPKPLGWGMDGAAPSGASMPQCCKWPGLFLLLVISIWNALKRNQAWKMSKLISVPCSQTKPSHAKPSQTRSTNQSTSPLTTDTAYAASVSNRLQQSINAIARTSQFSYPCDASS